MKRTAFSRTMQYFREADLSEARAALDAATTLLRARDIADKTVIRKTRTRRARTNGAETAIHTTEATA